MTAFTPPPVAISAAERARIEEALCKRAEARQRVRRASVEDSRMRWAAEHAAIRASTSNKLARASSFKTGESAAPVFLADVKPSFTPTFSHTRGETHVESKATIGRAVRGSKAKHGRTHEVDKLLSVTKGSSLRRWMAAAERQRATVEPAVTSSGAADDGEMVTVGRGSGVIKPVGVAKPSAGKVLSPVGVATVAAVPEGTVTGMADAKKVVSRPVFFEALSLTLGRIRNMFKKDEHCGSETEEELVPAKPSLTGT